MRGDGVGRQQAVQGFDHRAIGHAVVGFQGRPAHQFFDVAMRTLNPCGTLYWNRRRRVFQEFRQEFSTPGLNRQLRLVDATQYLARRMHVNQGLGGHGGHRKPVALSRDIAQAAAQCQHQVGGLQRFQVSGGNVVAQMAGVIRMPVGKQMLLLPADRNRQLERLAHLDEERDVLWGKRGTHDHDGAQRRGQHFCGARDIRCTWRGNRRHRRRHRGTGCGVEEHVLRQGNEHRSGNARGGTGDGLGADGGEIFSLENLPDTLAHAAEGFLVIDFLEGAAADVLPFDLSDENQQRYRILLGHMDRKRCIRSTGTARHAHHAGAPREF